MNIICNQLEYTTALNLLGGFDRLLSPGIITYSNESDTDQPFGAIKKETVTIECLYKDIVELENSHEFYVLRLQYGDSKFNVGTENFPAKKTFSTNKVTAVITFECQSPI